MIRLVQPPRAWGLPNVSPPCMKLETWLRITGIPYEPAPLDLAAAPKGKVPCIEEAGVRIGDSTLIIDHLQRTRRVDPDDGLSASERATSLAFRRMLKENFYWVIVEMRYRTERNWQIYRKVLASILHSGPEGGSEQAADEMCGNVTRQMYGHGMGRHSAEEICRIGIEDITAVSGYLGSKSFFMGERPTTADAAVYAYMANAIEVPIEHPVQEHGRSSRNLVQYCERMRGRFFPELGRA
ncbi:glutathione S-transferase family protein [Sorangium sp. So ce134]